MVAGHDPDRYAVVLRWPLVEALLAFEAIVRERDLDGFRFELLLYAIGERRKRPEVPRSLQRHG